ncbi:hypothetical protein Sjap_000848 [Stephania japonica]|uniref:Uncharacterized protein n=1 Tax=Stephania japonica TaxID=461633 RepID=A0AAP0PQX2_9MAGN
MPSPLTFIIPSNKQLVTSITWPHPVLKFDLEKQIDQKSINDEQPHELPLRWTLL